MNVRKGWSDVHHFIVLVAVFASSVACAIFVGGACEDIEMHMFGPLTGQEERFRRTGGWL
jgi:hypothetical protein